MTTKNQSRTISKKIPSNGCWIVCCLVFSLNVLGSDTIQEFNHLAGQIRNRIQQPFPEGLEKQMATAMSDDEALARKAKIALLSRKPTPEFVSMMESWRMNHSGDRNLQAISSILDMFVQADHPAAKTYLTARIETSDWAAVQVFIWHTAPDIRGQAIAALAEWPSPHPVPLLLLVFHDNQVGGVGGSEQESERKQMNLAVLSALSTITGIDIPRHYLVEYENHEEGTDPMPAASGIIRIFLEWYDDQYLAVNE